MHHCIWYYDRKFYMWLNMYIFCSFFNILCDVLYEIAVAVWKLTVIVTCPHTFVTLLTTVTQKKLKSWNNLLIIPHSFLPHTPNLNICLQTMKQKSWCVSCHCDSADNEGAFGSNLPYAPFLHYVICKQETFFMFPRKP